MVDVRAWERIRDSGFPVPEGDPRGPVTELCGMLTSPDPRIRDETALPVLDAWVSRGVCDWLLADLGDRLCAMLHDDEVFGRAFAVLAVGMCVDRDSAIAILDETRIRTWAREVTDWLHRETDARGYVDGSGWAHAFAHGADAIGALARSPRLDEKDLAWLLDETAAIIRRPSDPAWWHGEPDRWSLAIREVLTRDLLPPDAWHSWIDALAAPSRDSDPYRDTANAGAVLRALRLHLSLGATDPLGLTPALDRHLRPALHDYLE